MHKITAILLLGMFITMLSKVFVIKSIKRIRKLNRLAKTGEQTTGIIVDFTTQRDVDGVVCYEPVIEYKYDQKVIRSVSSIPVSKQPEIGDKLKVYFDKSDPSSITTNFEEDVKSNIVTLLIVVIALFILIYFTIKYFN